MSRAIRNSRSEPSSIPIERDHRELSWVAYVSTVGLYSSMMSLSHPLWTSWSDSCEKFHEVLEWNIQERGMLPLSLRKSGFLFTLSKLRKSHQISPIGSKANVIFDTNSPSLSSSHMISLTAHSSQLPLSLSLCIQWFGSTVLYRRLLPAYWINWR